MLYFLLLKLLTMTISGRYISALLRDLSSIVGFRSSSPSARVYSLKFPLTSKSRGSVRESTTLCDVSSKEGPTEIDFLKYKDSFGDLEISSSQWDKMEEMAARDPNRPRDAATDAFEQDAMLA